jgi:hypothetical protein
VRGVLFGVAQSALTKAFPLTPRDTDVTWSLRNSEAGSLGDKTSKPPEKAMKTRLFVLAGVAISFAFPTFAQDQNAVDPKVREQIEAVLVKYNEAVNKHDAAAVAALFTEDALQAWDWDGGVNSNSGKKAIQNSYDLGWESTPFVGKVLQVYAIGNDIAALSEFSAGDWRGYKVWVFFPDVHNWKITWKIRMQYATLAPRVVSSAATPSPTASPGNQ